MGFIVTLQAEDSEEETDVVIKQSIPALDEEGKPNIVRADQTVVLTYSTGTTPTQKVSITFAVPGGLKGKADFTAYLNGVIAGSVPVDNIGYVSTISIPVEGTGNQKAVIEVKDAAGNTDILGEYNIDFGTKTVSEVRFDRELLSSMFGVPAETEPPVTEPPFAFPSTDPPSFIDPGAQTSFSDPFSTDPEIIDHGDYEDWWNSIINGY